MGETDSESREREELAFNRRINWEEEGEFGTVFFGPQKRRQFPPLDIGTIRALAASGHLDLDGAHNDAPRAGELLEFAEFVVDEYREYQFEVGLVGYMVSPERSDSRIRLEGLSIRSPGPIPDELKATVIRRFSPEMLSVDDFSIELLWD